MNGVQVGHDGAAHHEEAREDARKQRREDQEVPVGEGQSTPDERGVEFLGVPRFVYGVNGPTVVVVVDDHACRSNS